MAEMYRTSGHSSTLVWVSQ